jgi:hypothetical protein
MKETLNSQVALTINCLTHIQQFSPSCTSLYLLDVNNALEHIWNVYMNNTYTSSDGIAGLVHGLDETGNSSSSLLATSFSDWLRSPLLG